MGKWLECLTVEHQGFSPSHQIMVGMSAHSPPSSKWVPGGRTGKLKGGEEVDLYMIIKMKYSPVCEITHFSDLS